SKVRMASAPPPPSPTKFTLTPAVANRGCERRTRAGPTIESDSGISLNTTKCGTPVSTRTPRTGRPSTSTSTPSSNPRGSLISNVTDDPRTSARCTITEVSTVIRPGAIPCRYATRAAQRAPLPQTAAFPSGLTQETRRSDTAAQPVLPLRLAAIGPVAVQVRLAVREPVQLDRLPFDRRRQAGRRLGREDVEREHLHFVAGDALPQRWRRLAQRPHRVAVGL